jgi:hypothetical protein
MFYVSSSCVLPALVVSQNVEFLCFLFWDFKSEWKRKKTKEKGEGQERSFSLPMEKAEGKVEWSPIRIRS